MTFIVLAILVMFMIGINSFMMNLWVAVIVLTILVIMMVKIHGLVMANSWVALLVLFAIKIF